MANTEHLDLVRQGSDAIAKWWQSRDRQKGFLDLQDADLRQTNLRHANLAMADLTGAELMGADLTEATLAGASLLEADCRKTNLFGAFLSIADLTKVDLCEAMLAKAMLSYTDLTETDLTDADLSETFLYGANFSRSDLNRTNFTKAMFGQTILAAIELSQAIGLDTAFHSTHSSVGIDTLQNTLRESGNVLTQDLRLFFRGTGVPARLLEALPAIMGPVIYRSCFISYGETDLDFARKLYSDLKEHNVSCWLYAMDATVGLRSWGEINQKQRETEKTVVLCSANALVRDGVLKEIEGQIDADPDKLVPVSLDDLWKHPGFRVIRGARDLKPFLLDRNYADFANMTYEEALKRLLKGLQRPESAIRLGGSLSY